MGWSQKYTQRFMIDLVIVNPVQGDVKSSSSSPIEMGPAGAGGAVTAGVISGKPISLPPLPLPPLPALPPPFPPLPPAFPTPAFPPAFPPDFLSIFPPAFQTPAFPTPAGSTGMPKPSSFKSREIGEENCNFRFQ